MSQDPTYGVDNFQKPKILSESETIVNNILTILFSKPGSFPSNPYLGMDIPQYLYSLEGDLDINSLKSTLAFQCSDFIEIINNDSFDIQKIPYQGNMMLMFILPIIIKNIEKRLVIGISINKNREMIYNYQLVEQNQL